MLPAGEGNEGKVALGFFPCWCHAVMSRQLCLVFRASSVTFYFYPVVRCWVSISFCGDIFLFEMSCTVFLLPYYFWGGGNELVDCCILRRELYLIIVIFSPSIRMNRLTGKHRPMDLFLLISLNISALMIRGLFVCGEGSQENASSLISFFPNNFASRDCLLSLFFHTLFYHLLNSLSVVQSSSSHSRSSLNISMATMAFQLWKTCECVWILYHWTRGPVNPFGAVRFWLWVWAKSSLKIPTKQQDLQHRRLFQGVSGWLLLTPSVCVLGRILCMNITILPWPCLFQATSEWSYCNYATSLLVASTVSTSVPTNSACSGYLTCKFKQDSS